MKSISNEHRFKELQSHTFAIIGDSATSFKYYKHHSYLLKKPGIFIKLKYFFLSKLKRCLLFFIYHKKSNNSSSSN